MNDCDMKFSKCYNKNNTLSNIKLIAKNCNVENYDKYTNKKDLCKVLSKNLDKSKSPKIQKLKKSVSNKRSSSIKISKPKSISNKYFSKDNFLQEIKSNVKKLKNSQLKELTTNLLYFNEEQRKKIILEKISNRNVSIAFQALGDWGEYLTTVICKKSFGGGSKGGNGFDNIEIGYSDTNKKGVLIAREVKICCLIQPKKCLTCKDRKVPFFQKKCTFCNMSNFKSVKDSRFGIDAHAQVKYNTIIKEYILFIVDYDNKTENIILKCYKIVSDNNYFQEYIINQVKKGKSTTCNLLPYSYDFYLSGPILLFDFELTPDNKVNKIFYNLENSVIEDIPISVFNEREIKKYNINIRNREKLNYNRWINKFELRNKSLGKNRGTLNRIV